MANFAVAAREEVIAKGNGILKRMAAPGETKGDTLSRAFDLISTTLDGEIIQSGGVDTGALEAALSNIRSQFLTAASGRNELLAKKDAEILELRNAKTRSEEELRKRAEASENAVKQAEAAANTAREEAEKSRKELEQASQMVKCIDTFHARLARAEEMEKEYDRLKREKVQAEDLATALNQKLEEQEAGFNRQIQALKKDHAAEMEKLKGQMERSVSDAKKDAALEKEKALAIKEREMNAQAAEKLREAERENIRLQMENEALGGSGGPGKVPFSERTIGDAEEPDVSSASAGMN